VHKQGEATTADPDLFRSIGFTQALELEERQELLRNTDASRASTKEQDTMLSEWSAGCL
jgi:hypothetical protein